MLNFIVAIIILLISIIFISKTYRNCKTIHEKIIFALMYVIGLSPTIIFYLDLYNIPSMFGYNEKIDTQNWLSFIMNYLGTIISAIIGAIFLVYMTMYQINKSNEDNDKRDQENYRIQNMPLLKYEITTDAKSNLTDIEHLIVSKFSENTISTYDLNILIKNIGLNSVKKICVELDSEIISKPIYLIDGKSQISIEKDETIEIYRYFVLKGNANYAIELNVYYEDVLNNWYLQKVEIDYKATNRHRGTKSIGKVIFIVNEEKNFGKNNPLDAK